MPSRASTETALRSLWLGVLWLVATAAAAFLGPFTFSFVLAFHNAFSSAPSRWHVGALVITLTSLVPLQLVLLTGALRRAKTVGHGNRSVGLGLGRIRRPGLLAGLALLLVVSAAVWALILLRWFGGLSTTLGNPASAASLSDPVPLAILLLAITLLAPLCEEMFFRGWLWTALARRWPPAAIALATSLPWLLLHIGDGGVRRPLFLIPAAAVLSLARHYCGGVAASLALHILNNSLAGALFIVALHTGHR